MMAGRLQSWRTLQLLILLSLLGFTQPFEVREDEWEELSPDIAALHRLRGLSEHMFHERIERDTSGRRVRAERATGRVDDEENPKSWQQALQDSKALTEYADSFLADINKQKTDDWLLTASEISTSYSQKLLVMTDKEKSTQDRIQEEYSLDPHYSVIVSRECLFNESCLPEADGYTVVKIFGSVSQNGQTVSGLSGASLARLMLKPSLEEAPVFSIDGNTTAEFKHNFMRVFMVRSSHAVLETNHNSHYIYQVMDQPDSVSSYRIPQRPVDHTTQYDHQQILMLQDDPVVREAAINLYEKHPSVSSFYVLDNNQKPKLIRGESVPLSEESRLVLVGHGARDNGGEMRLAGYKPQDVAKIIQSTSRVGNKIKTTSIVGCEVGADKPFTTTLLKELHDAVGIQTELHLREAVLQVMHTGEKITLEISRDGLQWRHKDNSKKVVATLDRNGNVVIRNDPGSKGEAVFTNERNFLGPKRDKTIWTNKQSDSYSQSPRLSGVRRAKDRYRITGVVHKDTKNRYRNYLDSLTSKPRDRFLNYRNNWPQEPKRFITSQVFERVDQNKVAQIKRACDELEGLSWGLFQSDARPKKVNVNNEQQIKDKYLIGHKDGNNMKWINDENQLKEILDKCYKIESGKDVRDVIRHYATKGEDGATYLMVKDWIYVVNPENLYVYPVGKKLDNNQIGNVDKMNEVQKCITDQIGRERYNDIRNNMRGQNTNDPKESYAQYVKDVFHGERTNSLQLSQEAWYTTYFTASVISESARNFRTFPLVLMALDLVGHNNNNIRQTGLDFLFDEHSMARGYSWIDPSRRGFSGSSTPEDSSKLNNADPRTTEQLMDDLKTLITRESDMFEKWQKTVNNVPERMSEIGSEYRIFGDNSETTSFERDYNKFNLMAEQQHSILNPFGHDGNHPASGTLGGNNDGDVTMRDLTLASELESSFKQESYFSRTSAAFAEEIRVQLKARHGQQLSGMHIKEGTARIEDGQFVCELVSKGADANKPVEFRAKLSPESQRYHKQMLKNMNKAVHDMELLSSKPSHQANKHEERTGTAVGALGLMLGMNGAVRAFEEGNIKDGVVGSLQTAHGLTAMTTSVIARQALSAETRIARVATAVMRSPAMKRTMVAIPIVGIGFGVYSLVQDLNRSDALGYIDAVLDGAMIGLDVVELTQPELAPFITPINLALSVVRMVTDDVYMAIQNELSSLPNGAGFLEKLGAVIVGFEKGILHFTIRVASVFYDWRYEEIEEGRRIVGRISDNSKYYTFIEQQDGTTAIDFSNGTSSWNGGGIYFCLADQGNSDFCMDYFVSDDEKMGEKCWLIDTHGSKDIVLGLGESHRLKYKKLQRKVLMFIPAGSVSVVSGYEDVQNSRYGTYRGNRDSNHFFAVQKAKDNHTVELMLSYYYSLHGEEGDDVFFLGPQRSYVEGSGGKDTYIIPENGGKTIINNYDPSKALDTLHLSIDYSRISVSKSGEDVVLRYEGSHTVIIKNWFLGEAYRHMSMVSGDGVLFEISSTVVSSVQLVARGINKMFKTSGQVVNAGQPLLRSVTNIFGSPHNDVIHGNEGTNLIDGGGGQDILFGGEGEDIYMVKDKKQSVVWIDNSSIDRQTDLAIIEAQFSTFKATVQDDDVLLTAVNDGTTINVILKNWFRSSADRHLFIVTKDLIKFTVSDNKTDCRWRNNCIQSLSIDYSSSPSALMVDLQENRAFDDVTEIRGSQFHDVIKGNKEHNVVIPGEGNDFIEGRGGEDWYIITPHQGVKTINNQSPDLALDVLFMKEQYRHLTCSCEGQSVIISVDGRRAVILQNWFSSKHHQHLQIKTSDGITAGLTANISSCGQSLLLPLSVDYRNQQPEPLWLEQHEFTHFLNGIIKSLSHLQSPQRHLQTCSSFHRECLSYLLFPQRHLQTCSSFNIECLYHLQSHLRRLQTCLYLDRECVSYLQSHLRRLQICSPFDREWYQDSTKRLFFRIFCSHQGKVMLMNDADSVKEMFGSPGFDVMVGNSNDNLLDPHTGGALMYGGEGKDTYIIKQGYGDQLLIHNFAEDQIIDTVLVDMDFLDGSRVVLNLRTPDLEVTVLTKGETFTFSLLSYSFGNQHQHVEFQSSDGVYFKVKSQNSTGDAPLFQIEAFKVTLQQSQADCRLDLSSYRNLSKVHTVQGCPSQSNNILGNHLDNAVIGGWKDDALDGGEGDDTLIGGNGADILIGGMGDDTLYGEDGNDTLMGNSGWDVFIPGPGADLVDGGPGRDAVLYRGDHKTGQGVYVNLLTGQGRHADAEGDVLKDVETVIGTIYSDILVSGYESSLLKGSDGNDILVSTGEDYLVGGDGRDIYLLAFDHGSVTIDNCAEDNATDVVYLSSQSVPVFDCQNLSDRVLLTFSETNQTTIKVALRGWISDDNECGHLVFAFRDVQKPVDTLLLECSDKTGGGLISPSTETP